MWTQIRTPKLGPRQLGPTKFYEIPLPTTTGLIIRDLLIPPVGGHVFSPEKVTKMGSNVVILKNLVHVYGWLSKCWFLDWVLIHRFHWGPLHKYLVGLPYLHFSKI